MHSGEGNDGYNDGDNGGGNNGINGGNNGGGNGNGGCQPMEAWDEGERAVEGEREGDEPKWVLWEWVGIFKCY